MRIVALDTFATDFDGLSLAAFTELGEFIAYPRTPASEVLTRCSGAHAVITNKVLFGQAQFSQLPELKYIGLLATGTNNVDLRAARERNIAVTNVPGYSTDAVAQMVFALLLELAAKTSRYAALTAAGEWTRSPDFCLPRYPIMELAGKKLGLVGVGAIGKRVAAVAEAFGMVVLKAALPGRSYQEPRTPLKDVLTNADIISLHTILTPETSEIINRETLKVMKRGALLINTARGGLLDEAAVAEALHEGQLGGAGVDVLSHEPPPAANPLLSAPNVVITPHVAWAGRDSRERLVKEAVENLRAFVRGERRNRVGQ